jgi:hypothetical protein
MKRRIAISLSFAVAVLAAITAFHSMGRGQTANRMRSRAALSTGVVSLKNGEYARLIVANAAVPGASSRPLRADLRLLQHAPSGQQQGSLVRNEVVDQTTSGQITLEPGESITYDFDPEHATTPNVGAVSFFINVEALPVANACVAPTATVTLEVHNKFADAARPVGVWVWVECDKEYVWM